MQRSAQQLSTRGRLMLAAAILTWAAVGLPYWLFGWSRVLDTGTEALVSGRLAFWAATHIGFLVALLLGHRLGQAAEGRLWARRLSVTAQAVFALAATAAFGDSLQAALLVIVATQTGRLFGLRAALAWITAQSAIFVWILSREEPLRNAVAIGAAFVGFQLFALLAVTMAEREAQARQELARTNAELEAARELLAESSRVAERLRISRELHDGLGHHLTALRLQLELATRLAEGGEGDPSEPVARAQEIAGRILDDLRRTVRSLRAEQPVDLATALGRIAESIPRPLVHLTTPRRLIVPDTVRANALVRSVQELATNAARHSGGENLWIEVASDGGRVTVNARDDGAGAAGYRPGSGLAGMRERIEGLGGTLWLDPAPGSGFRARLELPVDDALASGEPASERASDGGTGRRVAS